MFELFFCWLLRNQLNNLYVNLLDSLNKFSTNIRKICEMMDFCTPVHLIDSETTNVKILNQFFVQILIWLRRWEHWAAWRELVFFKYVWISETLFDFFKAPGDGTKIRIAQKFVFHSETIPISETEYPSWEKSTSLAQVLQYLPKKWLHATFLQVNTFLQCIFR